MNIQTNMQKLSFSPQNTPPPLDLDTRIKLAETNLYTLINKSNIQQNNKDTLDSVLKNIQQTNQDIHTYLTLLEELFALIEQKENRLSKQEPELRLEHIEKHIKSLIQKFTTPSLQNTQQPPISAIEEDHIQETLAFLYTTKEKDPFPSLIPFFQNKNASIRTFSSAMYTLGNMQNIQLSPRSISSITHTIKRELPRSSIVFHECFHSIQNMEQCEEKSRFIMSLLQKARNIFDFTPEIIASCFQDIQAYIQDTNKDLYTPEKDIHIKSIQKCIQVLTEKLRPLPVSASILSEIFASLSDTPESDEVYGLIDCIHAKIPHINEDFNEQNIYKICKGMICFPFHQKIYEILQTIHPHILRRTSFSLQQLQKILYALIPYKNTSEGKEIIQYLFTILDAKELPAIVDDERTKIRIIQLRQIYALHRKTPPPNLELFIQDIQNNITKDFFQEEIEKKMKKTQLSYRCNIFIEGFECDIYLPDQSINIEIDGIQHTTTYKQTTDKIRDDFLQSKGIRVYRIKGENMHEKFSNLFAVLREFAM